jgi:hypothetical protein
LQPNQTKNPYGFGTGRFGTDQEELIAGLQRIGDRLCQYGPLGTFPRRCDCKYGASSHGEESGCPEVALAAELVNAMTITEFKRLAKRAGVIL